MKLYEFIKKIHTTRDEEILCSDCLDQVSAYVDLELDGEPAETIMPLLKQHLDQCQICHDEYDLLRHMAILDRDGKLPSLKELKRQIREAKSGESTDFTSSWSNDSPSH